LLRDQRWVELFHRFERLIVGHTRKCARLDRLYTDEMPREIRGRRGFFVRKAVHDAGLIDDGVSVDRFLNQGDRGERPGLDMLFGHGAKVAVG
jgi:hypothetical protein